MCMQKYICNKWDYAIFKGKIIINEYTGPKRLEVANSGRNDG